jgi:16S rRNA (adenine1518-N6/adenine1519-N6)-dimethyltransferase
MAKDRVENLRLDKRKGQHILVDKRVISRQIEYAELSKDETVLEIGPGPGTLTFALAESAREVIAVEKDSRFVSRLKEKLPKNVTLINVDIMEMDLPKFDVCVSNLPYQISSSITFKLLSTQFQRAILMYQKEFANRMVAGAGDSSYSRLSVNVHYKADCKILEYVPKEAFKPVPEVDSAIIKLIPRAPPFTVRSEKMFFEIIEALFSQRRKKIKNPLLGYLRSKTKDIPKSDIKDFLNNLPNSDDRVDSLNPKEIGVLSDTLYDFAFDTPQ